MKMSFLSLLWGLIFAGLTWPVLCFGELETFSDVVTELRRNSSNRYVTQRMIRIWARNSANSLGFIQLGAVPPVKFRAAQRFHHYIHETFGFNLLLAPSIGNREVPAFDAVVLDTELKPIANVSLKSATQPSFGNIFIRSQTAIKRIESFSEIEAWAAFGLVRKPEHRNEDLTRFEKDHFSVMRKTLSTMASIFAPGWGRKAVLVFDIEDASQLGSEDLEALATMSRDLDNLSQVLMVPGKIITYSKGRFRADLVDSPPESWCSSFLASPR